MAYTVAKQTMIKLNDGTSVITTARAVDSKCYDMTNKSVREIMDFCLISNIPPEETVLNSRANCRIELVQYIYEDESVIRKRLETKRKQEYELYLSLKEKFKDV